MNARVHLLAGLAAASLSRGVVFAAEKDRFLPWALAAFAAVLPDLLERALRSLRPTDATLTPDPLLGDDALAAAVLQGLAEAAAQARSTGRRIRVFLRPLPSSRGRLRLLLLPRRAKARVLAPDAPNDAPESSADWTSAPFKRLPLGRAPWPAALDIPAPDGAFLTFSPLPGRKHALAVTAEAPLRGRGLPHSPALLLALPALVLALAPGVPLLAAPALGLLSHGLLDLCGDQGLPRLRRSAPGIGLHLWRDASRNAARFATLVATAVLLLGLIQHTSYVLHRPRCIALILFAAAIAKAGLVDKTRRTIEDRSS